MRTEKKRTALRVATDGIIAALALALSFLESLIPDIAFLPPGAKLGLANIAVMFAVMAVGYGDGLLIAVLKSGFVLFTRGAAAFFMSLSGGVFSCLTMIVLLSVGKRRGKDASFIGISVLCAVAHNLGQLVAACLYTGSNLVPAFLPALLLFGVIAGMLTGLVLKLTMPVLLKLDRRI